MKIVFALSSGTAWPKILLKQEATEWLASYYYVNNLPHALKAAKDSQKRKSK